MGGRAVSKYTDTRQKIWRYLLLIILELKFECFPQDDRIENSTPLPLSSSSFRTNYISIIYCSYFQSLFFSLSKIPVVAPFIFVSFLFLRLFFTGNQSFHVENFYFCFLALGTPIILICNVEVADQTNIEINWYSSKRKERISQSKILNLSNIKVSESFYSAVYWCNATNSDGTGRSQNVTVTVTSKGIYKTLT